LERIVSASSNEGDLILDPFCGCGTTINVAERLHRRWLGIDITHLAIALIKNRLQTTFENELSSYEVLGDPKDLGSARALAEYDRYQFQWWACGLVQARPAQDKKKGADTGIDGYINFFDDGSGKAKTIIVSVKSGHVTVKDIRDLKAVVDREKAVIGLFVTLEPSTKPMRDEALAAGYYDPQHLAPEHKAPKIQLFTIQELLDGAEPKYPRLLVSTFKRAPRKHKDIPPSQDSLL
jgi:site-specific DNA-methyltransferase (adenine-specific)